MARSSRRRGWKMPGVSTRTSWALPSMATPRTGKRVVCTFWGEELDNLDRPTKDPKTRLQEWAMARELPLPEYVLVNQSGPSHDPRFTIEVRLPGVPPQTATASAKREAEKDAAQRMLDAQGIAPE